MELSLQFITDLQTKTWHKFCLHITKEFLALYRDACMSIFNISHFRSEMLKLIVLDIKEGKSKFKHIQRSATTVTIL